MQSKFLDAKYKENYKNLRGRLSSIVLQDPFCLIKFILTLNISANKM